jgi:16S rRNA (cytidine1402-2'-O)-methyltransferase
MNDGVVGDFLPNPNKNDGRGTRSFFRPGVYFTATPIGHLDDISLRALKLLQQSTRILCEDTRVTQRLLTHYGIKKKLYRFDEYRERSMMERIGHWVHDEKEIIVVVSDAGTPLINDPGRLLVHYCQANDIYYTALPGACSWINALVLCGIDPIHTIFGGFIDQVNMDDLEDSPYHWVMFVSAHKVQHYLNQIHTLMPKRPLWIAREMTKVFEQTLSGTGEELLSHFHQHPPKGEMVLIVGGKNPNDAHGAVTSPHGLWEKELETLLEHHSLKDSVDIICHQFGFSKTKNRKIVYDEALKIKTTYG